MKKIDEIMELLTEEIHGFNQSILKLEELSRKLQDVKIKADTSVIEQRLKDQIQLQEKNLYKYQAHVREIKESIRRRQLFPKWLIILVLAVFGVSTITLGYFAFTFGEFQKNKQEAYMAGRREAISELQEYFEDHPIIFKDFERWTKKRERASMIPIM